MIFIEHRINTLEQLSLVNIENGVEIDLRSNCQTGKIHLHHDPFVEGTDFETWLNAFVARGIRGPVILNTKEDALEARLIELCEAKGLKNFFFLDTALPTLVKWSLRNNENRFACRLSIHEPATSLASFRKKVQWLWVDCFDGVPLDVFEIQKLKTDFKICLVAPELQGVFEVHHGFAELFKLADAICTKKHEFWRNF